MSVRAFRMVFSTNGVRGGPSGPAALVIAAVLIILLSPITSYAKDTAVTPDDTFAFGLERLHWDTTEKSAQHLIPALHLLRRDKHIDPNDLDPAVSEYEVRHYPRDGCDFRVRLQFYRGVLNGVFFGCDHSVTACRDRIKAEMISVYGPGAEYDHVDLGIESTQWNAAKTLAVYTEDRGFMPRYKEVHLAMNYFRKGGHFRSAPSTSVDPSAPAKALLALCAGSAAERAECDFNINLLMLAVADSRGGSDYCQPAYYNTEKWQSDGIPAVEHWLGAHPELGADTQIGAVRKALQAVYPCPTH